MSVSIDIFADDLILQWSAAGIRASCNLVEDQTMLPFSISDWLDLVLAMLIAARLLRAWASTQLRSVQCYWQAS